MIPPYADKLNAQIEKSKAFADCLTIIEDEEPGDKINTIKSRLPRWAKKIALEIGAAESEIESILIRKWLDYYESEIDVTSVKYRADEYAALSGKVSSSSGFFGDFSREEKMCIRDSR